MAPGLLSSPQPLYENSPIHPPSSDPHPSTNQLFLSTLATSPYAFLEPSITLHTAALLQAKRYLDPLASSISQAQQQRLQSSRKKRKRGEHDDDDNRNVLRLKQVHLEGFSIEQVWEQARRVLDASRREIERQLPDFLSNNSVKHVKTSNGTIETQPHKAVRFEPDGSGVEGESDPGTDNESRSAFGEEANLEETADNPEKVDKSGNDVSALDEEDEGGGPEEDEIDVDGLIEEDDDVDLLGLESDDEKLGMGQSDVFVPDKNGLNDGFFSIDDFNRTSQFLEQRDIRGDDDGAASDEEEIDWNADPTKNVALQPRSQKQTKGLEPDDSEDDGPTFGNADLNAPFSDSDASDEDDTFAREDDDGALGNTNEILYADFFAPPARSLTKTTRRRALPKTQPPPTPLAPTETEIQRTISAVHRDIFSDEDSGPSGDENDPSTKNLSSHEKRQAALAAQIRALEAENLKKRSWQLSGEARAQARPLNSLLEEDLDFERAGKPVSVVTAEVSEGIEALIKRRILARDFDEVIKRRPGVGLGMGPGGSDVRRGRIEEVNDKKDERGLGELYEEEHLRGLEGSGFVEKKDEKIKAQEAQIEKLWKDVSAKLDALANFRFKPKPPEVLVSVVNDVPRAVLEDARPAGVQGIVGEEGGLAPQEVFKVEKGKDKRRKKRERERANKEGEKNGDKGRNEKESIVRDLKKGGVKVIGKKGEIRDVDGKAVRGKGSKSGKELKL